jgi:hypothetical protein
MYSERRVVDNRVFLLGLDGLYREAMKQHERGELLLCARRVASALRATAADVPVEGYYTEDARLTEYFRLVRALQEIDEAWASSVASLPEFRRLREITSAPLFGRPTHRNRLLPVGRDALSQALRDTFPEWTVKQVTSAAYAAAREMDDISLVGLAARVKDAVVLTAIRESVVLYAEPVSGCALNPPPPEYVWKVDEELARHARRFVDTFNTLVGHELPTPEPIHAESYWQASDANEILGRCVRLGFDDTVSPKRHYHWAICRGTSSDLEVQDFWKPEVWTTKRYRSVLRIGGRCPQI